MSKVNNSLYLFKRSWRISKGLFFTAVIKSIFIGILPLVNIAGIGIVVNSLVNNYPSNEVWNIILFYVLINLIFGIISDVLDLIDIILKRKTSNVMQMEYLEDSININYHYVQDKSILDSKKKTMHAHPALFLEDMSKFSSYIIQFTGIIFIFSILCPNFLIALLITSFLTVIITFYKKRKEFDFKNDCVEDEQRIDYLDNVMTGYRYAKEIRINNGKDMLEAKYHQEKNRCFQSSETFIIKSTELALLI